MATEIIFVFKQYKLMELLYDIDIYEFFVLYEESIKKKYDLGNKKNKDKPKEAKVYEGMSLEEYEKQKNA